MLLTFSKFSEKVFELFLVVRFLTSFGTNANNRKPAEQLLDRNISNTFCETVLFKGTLNKPIKHEFSL